MGGHSIKDEEPKYGLAVTGLVDPRRMITNDALRPGQRLLLSKPIGTGVVAGAGKRSLATAEQVAAMVASMCRLNREASERAVARGVRAGTDVTGFGLAGHLIEMARASRCSARLFAGSVPLLPGALEHAEADRFPGGSKANRAFFSTWTRTASALSEALVGLLFDAQTSGGLLLGVDPAQAEPLLADLLATGHTAALIGEVTGPSEQGELELLAGPG
jgi:selenide,water dikinase